jgi:hypothetical protein
MKTLKKSEFAPNPVELLKRLAEIKEYGIIFGFIHGSYVYNNTSFTCASYKETQYFMGEKYIESQFTLKNQPPDVDIVVVAKNPDKFHTLLKSYLEANKVLDTLNYFLTLNVMTEETFLRDLHASEPTAIKRILKFRQIIPFGDVNMLNTLISNIDIFVTDLDYVVQHEYDERKEFLKKQFVNDKKEFKLDDSEYRKKFPAYLQFVLLGNSAGFPEDREKIVLPHSMGLKEKVDYTSGLAQSLR